MYIAQIAVDGRAGLAAPRTTIDVRTYLAGIYMGIYLKYKVDL